MLDFTVGTMSDLIGFAGYAIFVIVLHAIHYFLLGT